MEKTIVAFLLYAVHISSALDSNIQLVRENGEIKLTCLNTFSESLETETWYKNGRRLNFSPQEIPFTDGTLTFPDQVEYEAVYQCFGNSSANKNTSVRATPEVIRDPPLQRQLYIAEEKSFNLRRPFKFGNITREEVGLKWVLHTVNSSCFQREHCRVDVDHTAANIISKQFDGLSADSIITCEITGLTPSVESLAPSWMYNVTIYRPLIARVNASETVYERIGHSTILECSATSPTPDSVITYAWFKDGNETTRSTDSRLLLSDLMLADSGVYRCNARVRLGNDTELESNASTTVTIVGEVIKYQLNDCPPANGTLKFSFLPENATVQAEIDRNNIPVTLDCDYGQNTCKFNTTNFSEISFSLSIGGNNWKMGTMSTPECTNQQAELKIELDSCPTAAADFNQHKLETILRDICLTTNALVCSKVTVTEFSCSDMSSFGLLQALVSGTNISIQLNQTCNAIKKKMLGGSSVRSCEAVPREPGPTPGPTSSPTPGPTPNPFMVQIISLFALVGVLITIAIVLSILLIFKMLKKRSTGSCRRHCDIEAAKTSEDNNEIALVEIQRHDDSQSHLHLPVPLPNQVDQTPSLPSYNTACKDDKPRRQCRDKTPKKADNRSDREPSQGCPSKSSQHSCGCSCNKSVNSQVVPPLRIPSPPTIDSRTTVVILPLRMQHEPQQPIHILPSTTYNRSVDNNRHPLYHSL